MSCKKFYNRGRDLFTYERKEKVNYRRSCTVQKYMDDFSEHEKCSYPSIYLAEYLVHKAPLWRHTKSKYSLTLNLINELVEYSIYIFSPLRLQGLKKS